MNLCIYSNKSIEELIKLVEDLFVLIPKLDNFKMPRYDEVKPYDEKNLKYFFKIVPIKDINEISLAWYLPYCEDYYSNPLGYLSSVIGHEGPFTLTSSLNKDNLINSLVSGQNNFCKAFSIFCIIISLT